eukprot:Platyproteum_vivax@DN2236_c0_g1_i1.p1
MQELVDRPTFGYCLAPFVEQQMLFSYRPNTNKPPIRTCSYLNVAVTQSPIQHNPSIAETATRASSIEADSLAAVEETQKEIIEDEPCLMMCGEETTPASSIKPPCTLR